MRKEKAIQTIKSLNRDVDGALDRNDDITAGDIAGQIEEIAELGEISDSELENILEDTEEKDS